LSGGTLRQTGLPSRAAARNSCRKNIGFSKLSLDSTLNRTIAERREYSSSSLQVITSLLEIPIFHREMKKIGFSYLFINTGKEHLFSLKLLQYSKHTEASLAQESHHSVIFLINTSHRAKLSKTIITPEESHISHYPFRFLLHSLLGKISNQQL